MSEALREMTYDEQIANFIINILAIETPFGVKRDLIGGLLSLTYRHERDIKDALYTPTPSCTLKAEEGTPADDVRPVVLCKDCRHRDPEDHKCDCGQPERQGCMFSVRDNYWCACGEKREE